MNTVWLMDTDICECGAILDYFGECPYCEYEDEDDYIEDDDGYDAESDMKQEYQIALREGGYYQCFPEREDNAQ